MAPGGTPSVTEDSQQLKITLAPNTAGYNGVSSNSLYNLTDKMVQVEVVQAVSQAGWCENMLELELNPNNYFLINIGVGNCFDALKSKWRQRPDETFLTIV